VPTFKLVIEYDGTAYAGWQRQPNQPTVQSAIEDVIQRITQIHVSVTAAGRTDAGVHALGQVVSFRSDKGLAAHEWLRALNGLLPPDISVRSVESAPEGFHARYSARHKQYDYRILNRAERSGLERNRVWHVRGPLDLDAMREAARLLVGRHDFSSFQGHPTETESALCNLTHLNLIQEQDVIRIQVQADRFLKQMVRAIVGTLVEVGQAKRAPESMKNILAARDRRAAGLTAPAQGLYLIRVEYEGKP
jgi:tRNA pseudouridine38-40 synthase